MKTHTQAIYIFRYIVITLLLTLTGSVDVLAATLWAISDNHGSFAITANDLNRLISGEVRIAYQVDDQSQLPQVTGSFLVRKTNNKLVKTASLPGYLEFRFELDKNWTLSGYKGLAVAKISGDITSLTATFCYQYLGCETVQGSVTNPASKDQDKKTDQSDTGGKSGTSDTTTAATDSSTKPSSRPDAGQPVVAQVERVVPPAAGDTTADRTTSQPSGESGIKPSSSASADRKTGRPGDADDLPRSLSFARRASLFERFSVLSGERTVTTLARLLERSEAEVTQDPPLLLSDGTASLTVTIRPHGSGKQSPQFFISGSSCIDVKAGENGVWILEIVPERGSLNASVMVLADNEAIEYPLAVAPLLEIFDVSSAKPGLAEFVRVANELVRSKPGP